ncbi:MAG TPA: zinc ribbon domain-containing protein [Chloroflexota bacterium]
MPIYEYRCHGCRKRVSVFFRSFNAISEPVCPECGSRDLTKLVSRVAVMKSEESRLEELSDPSSMSGLDENDPKSIAKWAKKMGSAMGEDLGPEYDEMIDRMEAGEMPDDDAMGGPGGMGGMDDAGGLGGDD